MTLLFILLVLLAVYGVATAVKAHSRNNPFLMMIGAACVVVPVLLIMSTDIVERTL